MNDYEDAYSAGYDDGYEAALSWLNEDDDEQVSIWAVVAGFCMLGTFASVLWLLL